MKLGGIFSKAIPFLAAAIPGGGVVSKMAFDIIGKVTGTTPKDADEAASVLATATPEQMLALQSEEHNFKLQLETLNIKSVEELERIAAGDRDSARNREIKTGDSWTPRLITAVILGGYVLVQWFILTHIVPPEMLPIVMRSLGTLDTIVGIVVGYYFGSSAGSAAKNALIAEKVK